MKVLSRRNLMKGAAAVAAGTASASWGHAYASAPNSSLPSEGPTSPLFNIFELGIQQGQIKAYNAVGEANITTSLREEEGTLAMYSARRKDNPYLAYMFEIYASEEAYQKHAASAQYQEFLNQSPHILTDHKQRIPLHPQFLGDRKVLQTAQTVNTLTIVDVKTESAQDFQGLVLGQMAQSLKTEAGVLGMYAGTVQDTPTRWYFYEIYTDKRAYRRHRTTRHFRRYWRTSQKMIQSQQDVLICPTLLMNKGNLRFQA